MFSFCIPIYNFDVRDLVTDIHSQASKEPFEYEILLLDDGSNLSFKKLNCSLAGMPNVVYDELDENVGRSRIRNLLANRARFRYLIFMDCDSLCSDGNFVRRYYRAANGDIIVVGGRIYDQTSVPDENRLHFLYGSKREVFSIEERLKNPYKSFMTNNFMITSTLFSKFSFNERLKGYGHEDTLFGFEMMQENIPIHHIENQLIHQGLESASIFLDKTRQGIQNLVLIYQSSPHRQNLAKWIKLLGVYEILKKYRLRVLVRVIFQIFQKLIERNLLGKSPNLLCFDFFKLGCFCQIIHKQEGK